MDRSRKKKNHAFSMCVPIVCAKLIREIYILNMLGAEGKAMF